VEKEMKSRRDILKKSAAFIVPVVTTFTLTELKVSASGTSNHGNNGHGNGDQDAPGGSFSHNGAENDQTP
jgi:hypothetical protein